MRNVSVGVAVLALAFGVAGSARADLISQNRPISGSGYYASGGETFPFNNVVDGRYNDTGSAFNWSFWLTQDRTLDNFTIDLQGLHPIASIALQNTHNRDYNDRGTNGFTISVSSDGTTFTPILTGSLASVVGTGNNIPIEQLDLVSPVTGRYVKFQVDSYYGVGGGLNEIEIYDKSLQTASVTPEPSALALCGTGVFLVAAHAWRRRWPATAK